MLSKEPACQQLVPVRALCITGLDMHHTDNVCRTEAGKSLECFICVRKPCSNGCHMPESQGDPCMADEHALKSVQHWSGGKREVRFRDAVRMAT